MLVDGISAVSQVDEVLGLIIRGASGSVASKRQLPAAHWPAVLTRILRFLPPLPVLCSLHTSALSFVSCPTLSPRSAGRKSQIHDKACEVPSEHTLSAFFDHFLGLPCLHQPVLFAMSASASLSPQQLALLPHDNAGPTLLIVCWSLTSLATIFLGLRIYCKLIGHRGLYCDDWVLIAAWVS